LGSKLKFIIIAGLAYVGVSATRDIMLIVAVEKIQELSESFEKGLFDFYTVLTFVVAALDVLFAMWILDALSTTMEYLESLKQTRKLKRYLALRCLFLFAVLFATVWVIFAVVNSVASGIVEEEDAWLVDGATEVNYLIVLMGVAWMWRPNPSAREYAYAMELPSGGGMTRDDETGVTELELTGVVPSAMDSDDDMEHDDDDDDDDYDSNDGITPPSSRNGERRKNGGFS
jgi:Lung seven transmembrane receptor